MTEFEVRWDHLPEVEESREALPAGKLPSELLSSLLKRHPVNDPNVVVGPGLGLDAAVVRIDDEFVTIKSDPISLASENMARYLVNVNANDLACMGCRARWMLVTALLPEHETTSGDVERLFYELNAVCQERGIAIIGGHTEVTVGLSRPILVGFLLGQLSAEQLLTPGNARPGDRLLVTKGIAIEGSALLAREHADLLASLVGDDMVTAAASFLDSPGISVVDDAFTLLATGGVAALHDPTEGGLATGIREMAQVSGCGSVISRAAIPILPETAAICDALDIDPLGLLASGCLLAAIRPSHLAFAESALNAAGVDFAWIGKLTPPEGGHVIRDGTDLAPMPEFAVDEIARISASVAQR